MFIICISHIHPSDVLFTYKQNKPFKNLEKEEGLMLKKLSGFFEEYYKTFS